MSRRRSPKQSKPWIDEVTVGDIEVVCSGGARPHNKVSFGEVHVLIDGGINLRIAIDEYVKLGEEPDVDGFVPKTFPFVCRRCDPWRNVPLRHDRLVHLCRGLAEAGVKSLDLAALSRLQ